MRIVLASASPRRRELLDRIGLSYEIHPSDAAEVESESGDPVAIARHNAVTKAQSVARRFPQDVVIGADTIVVLGAQILHKPTDRADAIRMLSLLQGRSHRVVTAVAVCQGERRLVEAEETEVWIRPLNRRQIERYVDSGEPMDKAGAYAAQGRFSPMVERIQGCYYNVVGLPLARLVRMLENFGIDVIG